MQPLYPSLSDRLREMWRPAQAPRTPRAFRCRCGRPVFFRNSVCLACGTPLGYIPERLALLPLESEDGLWTVSGEPDGPRYRNCGNLALAGCNWLLAVDDPAPLCVACRLNRTIPDLAIEENRAAWRSIEGAKRRLVSQLLALGLPVASRVPGSGGEDPLRGLLFDFVRSVPGHHVLTGHAGGVITVNIAEADDAVRESNRVVLREPYRTLLGHLRHEVGHYYWDRLVAGSDWHEPFRRTFGNEREDYAAALQRNRDSGPPPDWAQRCVSAYASTHPWEDWAETWAHYLHMMDTLDTALSFGFHASHLEVDIEPFAPDVLEHEDPDFLHFLNTWIGLTALLNEMSRSMGQPFFYPFVLSAPAVRKLHFVHRVVVGAAPPA